LGNNLLAAAGFPGDQHVDIRIGDMSKDSLQIFHHRRLTDQRQAVLGLFGGAAQRPVFHH
jgi:hypothetical protein